MLKSCASCLSQWGCFIYSKSVLRIWPANSQSRLSSGADKMKQIRRITGKPKGKLAVTVQTTQRKCCRRQAWAGRYPRTAGRLSYWRCFGLLMGLALNNIPAALVLAAGLGCSPLIVIRIRTGDYVRGLNEKLESAMGYGH